MSVTIKVKYKSLTAVIADMEMVARSARARSLQVSLPDSRGDYAREMEFLGTELYQTGQAFAEIARKTAEVLRNANIEFRKADNTAASQFNG